VILTGPEVITRGWVYEAEAEGLLEECESAVADSVKSALSHDAVDIETLSRHVRRTAGKFVNERTKRRPMIVPVIMET
jgi:ribonuclease J